MNTTEKKFLSPKIYPLSRSKDALWFIKYHELDYTTGKPRYYKYYGDLNLIPDLEERAQQANRYVEMIQRGENLVSKQGQKRISPSKHPEVVTNVVQCCYNHIKLIELDVLPKTISQYESRVRVFSGWLSKKGWQNLAIGGISYEMAVKFRSYLHDECKYSHKTCNDFKILLGSIWSNYVDEGKIKTNPWKKLKSLSDETQHLESYPDSLRKLINEEMQSEDIQLWIFMLCVYYCAFRPNGELRNMKVSDLDIYGGKFTVRKEIAKGRKKGRYIVIPEQLLDILKSEGYNKYPGDYYLFGKDGKPGKELVCINYFTNRWRNFRVKHAIPSKYKLYGAKHTAGKELSLKFNEYYTKQHFGHSEMKSTNHYTSDLSPDKLKHLKNGYPSF